MGGLAGSVWGRTGGPDGASRPAGADLTKGVSVAGMRPIASDAQQMPEPGSRDRDLRAGAALSAAQQRALYRSAPLSTTEFKALGQLVQRGDLPLRRLLRQRRGVH